MPGLPILRRLAGCGLTAALLVSCSIRLPVPSEPAARTKGSALQAEACAAPEPQVNVRRAPWHANPPQDPDVLVWLIADKWHTGMVFPYAWLEESGFVPPADFGHPRFVTMSWGNRNAYSREGIDHYWKFMQVILTPTPSVMEVIPVEWNVTEVLPQQRIWRKLVARTRGPALARFLNKCSATGPDGRPKVVRPSSWGHGVQLECRYSYFIPRVCNVWTVQTIECLGGTIDPWFALTADGLVRQAEKPPNDFELVWPGNGEIH